MHAAKLASSPRLQRILSYLKEAGQQGVTSLQIVHSCNVVAPATYVSELRQNGYIVSCDFEGTTPTGAKVYRYRLASELFAA